MPQVLTSRRIDTPPRTRAATNLTCRRIRPWELLELAAAGSLTEVYRARPEGSGTRQTACYAIKILRSAWETEPRAVEMLRREALAGRTVSHPHLISILAANVGSPPYYVVMPWIAGTTLADRLARRKTIDPRTALWVARQAAEALDALARGGWTHGDIKPGNILMSPEGHVTLLDLGFARQIDGADFNFQDCLTGTWQYMAPELFGFATRPDVRSDLYSLGITLFEMLSGRAAFSGTTATEFARQHRQARIAGFDEVATVLPAAGRELLKQMVAKHPMRRPQTPREVVERLVAAEIACIAGGCRAATA